MKHITFLEYVITSTVPELAVETGIFSDTSPGLFYAPLFSLENNSPMCYVLTIPSKNTTVSCSRLDLSALRFFSSLKLQMRSTEHCKEKHNGLLLGFTLETNKKWEIHQREQP